MAARVLGWAQRRTKSTSTGDPVHWVNASTNTPLDPKVSTLASARAFEVTAGVPVSIRWGGNIGGALPVATNTATWIVRCVYELGAHDVGTGWMPGAQPGTSEETVVQVGSPAITQTLDRTITFTPDKTGTIRVFVRVQVKVTATNSVLLDIHSDGTLGAVGTAANFGSPLEVYPAGTEPLDFAPGLVRCGTSLTSLTVNGLTGNNAGYADSISDTIVTGHAPRVADTASTLSWRNAANDTQFHPSTFAAGTTTSITDTAKLVDNTWPTAAIDTKLVLTPNSSALSTALSGEALPWLHFETPLPTTPGTVTTTTSASGKVVSFIFTNAYTADPRLTFSHILQIDSSTYATPPTASTFINALRQRLTSTLGFLASRVVNSNAVGINLLVMNSQLWDNANLVYATGRVINSATATDTKGGQAGWTDVTGANEFVTWNDSLPGGAWTFRQIITTSTATGLELTNSVALSLLASDPRVGIAMAAGDLGTPSRHWVPGQALTVGVAAIISGVKTAYDAGTAKVSVLRFNPTLGTTEYLTNPGLTWVTGDVPDTFPMTPSAGDAKLALKSFSAANTAAFNFQDLIWLAQIEVSSVPYSSRFVMSVYGGANHHDAPDDIPDLDGLGGVLL